MQFDPLSFEYEETPDITIGDGAVGKLNVLIYVAILTACVYYLFSTWSPSEPSTLPKTVETGILS